MHGSLPDGSEGLSRPTAHVRSVEPVIPVPSATTGRPPGLRQDGSRLFGAPLRVRSGQTDIQQLQPSWRIGSRCEAHGQRRRVYTLPVWVRYRDRVFSVSWADAANPRSCDEVGAARCGCDASPPAGSYPIDRAVLTEYSERVAVLRVVHLPATARDQSTALGPLRLLVQARLQVGLRFSSDHVGEP